MNTKFITKVMMKPSTGLEGIEKNEIATMTIRSKKSKGATLGNVQVQNQGRIVDSIWDRNARDSCSLTHA